MGGALLLGLATQEAGALSVLLLLVFSGALAINLARGRRIECHCFGSPRRAPISWGSVLRNGLLGIPAVLVALSSSRYLSLDGALRGEFLAPGDPSLAAFLPAFLIGTTLLGCGLLLGALLDTGRGIVRATRGPLLGLPERRWLSRVLR